MQQPKDFLIYLCIKRAIQRAREKRNASFKYITLHPAASALVTFRACMTMQQATNEIEMHTRYLDKKVLCKWCHTKTRDLNTQKLCIQCRKMSLEEASKGSLQDSGDGQENSGRVPVTLK